MRGCDEPKSAVAPFATLTANGHVFRLGAMSCRLTSPTIGVGEPSSLHHERDVLGMPTHLDLEEYPTADKFLSPETLPSRR